MTVRKGDIKQELLKQCVETAIGTTNRIYDYRIREIDATVDQYIDMVPKHLRAKKVSSFSN